mmetsp:Transcript_4612/g.11644  ORF Transcript_4612/g.11644 Transcript_4612/m.11644 type:complete len:203 (+) Transcript_4612:1000-1608(+)
MAEADDDAGLVDPGNEQVAPVADVADQHSQLLVCLHVQGVLHPLWGHLRTQHDRRHPEGQERRAALGHEGHQVAPRARARQHQAELAGVGSLLDAVRPVCLHPDQALVAEPAREAPLPLQHGRVGAVLARSALAGARAFQRHRARLFPGLSPPAPGRGVALLGAPRELLPRGRGALALGHGHLATRECFRPVCGSGWRCRGA